MLNQSRQDRSDNDISFVLILEITIFEFPILQMYV